MLFHVKMVVNIPHDFDKKQADEVKLREKEYSRKLQESGKWIDIWRIVGEYANISIFEVNDLDELHQILSNLPLFSFMKIKVTPLCQHPSSIKINNPKK
jgi:muconolactone D-isomerase